MPPPRSRRFFPEVVTGYPLVNYRITLVAPAAAANLVLNPSLERDTTGWGVAGAAAIARSSAWQRRGAFSLAVTPTAGLADGCFFGTVPMTGGALYAMSVDILGAAGVPYAIYFANTIAQRLSPLFTFTATGRAQRPVLGWQPPATSNYRCYVVKNGHASTKVFYVDGLQVELAPASTYLDGDQRGFIANQAAYYWTGTPHGSASARILATRSGGVEVNLSKFGFSLLAVMGLGLTGYVNQFTPNAALGGSQYDGTLPVEHVFDIVGALTGRSHVELQHNRSNLEKLLRPNLGILQQPLLMRLQTLDDCGDPEGETVEIPCTFEPGGMAGQVDNDYQERVDLQFKIFLPYMSRREGEEGASLSYQQSVGNANGILRRTPAGLWQATPTGVTAGSSVQAIAVGQDGSIYAGGFFTTMGGVANTKYIAKWDGTAWSALGTGGTGGLNGVLALAIGPDGTVYAAGDFTSMGGVANTAGVAKWNGAAWSAMGTGITGGTATAEAWAFGTDGSLYCGGAWTTMGGVANTAGIAKWNGTAWSALGTGATGGAVQALVTGQDGSIYAGGGFTAMGGVANTLKIARWNGTAWSALGTGITGSISAMAVGPDGSLYIAGIITAAGGITVSNIARWNGASWYALGAGLTGGSPYVSQNGLSFIGSLLYIGGPVNAAGGLTLPSLQGNLVIWNGSAYVYSDVSLPGAQGILPVTLDRSGNLVVGFANNGTAVTAVVGTLTNSGTADAYPIFEFLGPGTVFTLVNYTTGDALYFNLTLLAGERATLDLRPGNLSFVSTFRGDIAGTILPGSNLGGWHLAPGANNVSAFISSVSAQTTLAAHWAPSYLAVEDALYTP
jgi:hypothetical protein